MQELAMKKRWMFARGSFAPPLVLFEEKAYADKPAWRDATPVLGAPNRPLSVEFKVSTQYRAGYHVSAEIPAVDYSDDQRLVYQHTDPQNSADLFVIDMSEPCMSTAFRIFRKDTRGSQL